MKVYGVLIGIILISFIDFIFHISEIIYTLYTIILMKLWQFSARQPEVVSALLSIKWNWFCIGHSINGLTDNLNATIMLIPWQLIYGFSY